MVYTPDKEITEASRNILREEDYKVGGCIKAIRQVSSFKFFNFYK